MKRRPLVYLEPAALAAAERLMPGLVPEHEVADAIVAAGEQRGRAAWNRTGVPFVIEGPGWRAVIERRPGRTRPRPRAWWVVRISATDRGRAAPSDSQKRRPGGAPSDLDGDRSPTTVPRREISIEAALDRHYRRGFEDPDPTIERRAR